MEVRYPLLRWMEVNPYSCRIQRVSVRVSYLLVRVVCVEFVIGRAMGLHAVPHLSSFFQRSWLIPLFLQLTFQKEAVTRILAS